jgi:hypothetical protein
MKLFLTHSFKFPVTCFVWRAQALHYKLEGRGTIPDGVTGILHRHYPSGRTRTMGPTQPLAEICTGNIS